MQYQDLGATRSQIWLIPIPQKISRYATSCRMALVCSLLFCADCGNLLDWAPRSQITVQCDICMTVNPSTCVEFLEETRRSLLTRFADKWPQSTTTHSKPDAFPSSLRQRLEGNLQIEHAGTSTWVDIQETCPKCDAQHVRYCQIQMRSADEGSTVLYACGCGNRWTLDN